MGFLSVSVILFPLFALTQKVEQKSQGRHDRSAHAAEPAHNNHSLLVNGFHSVLHSAL
jgi:hypothetical protein